MRLLRGFLPSIFILLAAIASLPVPLHADGAELVATDAGGVTLRVHVPALGVDPPVEQGRTPVRVRGFQSLSAPGRPEVPYVTTLVAVPPGARAVARIVASGDPASRSDLRVPIGGSASIRRDVEGLGYVPVLDPVEPILDGAWPASMVEVGEPFFLRRQRIVPVSIQPFRYDEATGTLSWTTSVTVRVDFVGGAGGTAGEAAEDRYWEPVFQGALVNYEQGRRMRGPRTASARSSAEGRPGAPDARSLFDRSVPGDAAFDRGPAAPAAPLGTGAFDENAPEIRIRVDSSAVYTIPFDELGNRGFPANVPVGEVSLHRHVFVSGTIAPSPAYQTLEIPIEVLDADGNGMFGPGDAIHAYVQNWAERSGAVIGQRTWGDADVVYATRIPGGAGLRMATRSAWRNQTGLTAQVSFPHALHLERNSQYMSAYRLPRDTALVDPWHWTSIIAYYGRADTILFETNDLDTAQAATVRINWVGRSSSSHFMWARITNNFGQPGARVTMVADSSNAFWTGRVPFTRTASVPGGALSEGATNRLGLWGKPSSAAPAPNTNEVASTGLNWFELTYWRRYNAVRGYLPCNSGAGSGEIEMVARGFTDTARTRIYDVTDPHNPVRLVGVVFEPDGGGWRARLQDSVAVGSPVSYVAFDTPRTLPASAFSSVARRRLYDNAAGDYLIVVPEAFLSAVNPLVNLRASQGLRVIVAPLEGIQDEFNGGRHAPQAIKRFFRFAYESWEARFAVLVGDGTEDPLNRFQLARPDWIPTQIIGGPVPFNTGFESAFERIPSDSWYGWCLTCDTEQDLQLQPKLLEMFVGRLPVNSALEASQVINKIVSYDAFTPDQLWRRKMVLLADDQYSGVSTFGGGPVSSSYCLRGYERRFRDLNDEIRRVILDESEAGLIESEPEVFDMRLWLANEPVCQPCLPDSCREDRFATQQRTRAAVTPELFRRLNEGRLWWNYQGHANEYEMAHEDIYRNLTSDDDKSRFMNDGKLFFFSAFSCHPNSFARIREAGPLGPAFGEELVTLPNRGAIASWASSGFEIIPHNGRDHVNVTLARALFREPPRDPYLGASGARPVLGEVIALTLLRWYPQSLPWTFEKEIGISYVLLGDPASRIWIGPPQASMTANSNPVTDGTPIRLNTPGDSLHLEARAVSNTAFSSMTLIRSDSTSTDTIPPPRYTVTPAFPDTGSASQGGRRYQVAFDTTLTPTSHTYSLRTVDRYGVARAFNAVFEFTTILRAGGQTVNDNDPVAPTADLSLQLLSPSPVTPGDLTLALNGVPVPFTATPVPTDPSGREWVLTWTHPPYPIDTYALRLAVNGGATRTHLFTVEVGGGELRIANAFAFPNPFQDDIGTHFSFTLVSGAPADVLLRVYTVNGRLVYERFDRALMPGYHQLGWDGRDAEGVKLANGMYLFRLTANNGSSNAMHEGRLVKLRRPRRGIVDEQTP